MSLYASRDGALYRSYDDFAGMQGFYEGQDGAQAYDPYAGFSQVSPSPAVQQNQISVQQPQMATRNSYNAAYFQSDLQTVPAQRGVETVMMPVPVTMSLPTQVIAVPAPPQTNSYEPVHFGPNLRGVGIKFGERIDSQSGGMHVYVKRVVPGSPADKAVSNPPGHRIQPGDSLLLINGEDVYGLGLDVLRERIPGPVGTVVTLGFKSLAGDLFEVELVRSAYALGAEEQNNAYAEQTGETAQLRVPRIGRPNQQRKAPNQIAENMYASVADGGYRAMMVQRAPSSGTMQGGQGAVATRTVQVPIITQNTVAIPVAVDPMAQTVVAQPQFFEGAGESFFAVAPMQQTYPTQLQFVPAMEYPMQVQSPMAPNAQFSSQQLMFPGQQQFVPAGQYAMQPQFAVANQFAATNQFSAQAQYQYAPMQNIQMQSMPQMMQMMPMQMMSPQPNANSFGQMQMQQYMQ